MSHQFDAIVIGSGMTGGWAAKELCEKGFKTLLLERGPNVEHRGPEYQDMKAPWEIENFGLVPQDWANDGYEMLSRKGAAYNMDRLQFFASQKDHPYSYPEDRPFMWTRGYQLGGRSLTWSRQSYRLSDHDFEANKRDGHGVDWPIRYKDLAPWYNHVEKFVGVSGGQDNIPHLPDGIMQPAFALNCAEQDFIETMTAKYPTRPIVMGRVANLTEPTEEQIALGRGGCQVRDVCVRGCSFGAYFSTQSATLPAAQRTGNLTLVTDAVVTKLVLDESGTRVEGVQTLDANTMEGHTYTGKLIVLCASTIASAQILLNSATEDAPDGLANSSDQVGRNIMDHVGSIQGGGLLPKFADRYEFGRRPASLYVPAFRNVTEPAEGFVRGFGFQGLARPYTAGYPVNEAGIGVAAKTRAETRLGWLVGFSLFGEMLPNENNRMTLHPTKTDKWGIPLAHIDVSFGENEKAMVKQAKQDLTDMLTAGGCVGVEIQERSEDMPGGRTHEMGTARMGRDPNTSVLNSWNQTHDIANLLVTDGSSMTSSATQNPSLTFMALTARAVNHAIELMKDGTL